MKKVTDKITSNIIFYGGWIVDMLLTFWLAFLSREVLLEIFAKFYKDGSWSYPRWVGVIDRFYTVALGLAWLAFMVIIEEYLRRGIQKGDILKRFARITGPLLLCIFVVDLIMFWLQGIVSGDWLRWLILAAELFIGIGLFVYYKSTSSLKTN